MKVYNENKTEVLETYDLELGYLKADKILEESHEAVPAKDAYDEYEDIQVYIPYTEEELAERKQQKYEDRVVELLRKKYSLNQELAILRQRNEKPAEYQAYHDYAEQCKATAKTEILGG